MKTTNQPVAQHSVPRQLRAVRFSTVSQVNIQAHPICAESKDDPSLIARECQAVATAHGLPVAFSCETASGTSRHTFYPEQPAAIARAKGQSTDGKGVVS